VSMHDTDLTSVISGRMLALHLDLPPSKHLSVCAQRWLDAQKACSAPHLPGTLHTRRGARPPRCARTSGTAPSCGSPWQATAGVTSCDRTLAVAVLCSQHSPGGQRLLS